MKNVYFVHSLFDSAAEEQADVSNAHNRLVYGEGNLFVWRQDMRLVYAAIRSSVFLYFSFERLQCITQLRKTIQLRGWLHRDQLGILCVG